MMNNQTEHVRFIWYLNISLNLFYVIFGNIGNLLKIIFFLQKPLRNVPCTIYILISTISHFITLNNLLILQILTSFYPNSHWMKVTVDSSNYENKTLLISYPISTYDIIICKIRSYLHMFSIDLSFQMLLFASINRFYSSYRRKKRQNSLHYLFRHFSNYPNVSKLCLISSLLIAFISLQHVFNFNIYSQTRECIPSNSILWIVWISSFHCFLLPIFIIIFGTLTLKSIGHLSIMNHSRRYHQRKHRFSQMCTDCSHYQNSIQYQIDRQLTSMIISEILVTILTSLPYGIYAFYHLVKILRRKTIRNRNESLWILLLIKMAMYFEPSCGFYIYLMTLTTLRKRFFRMFTRGFLTVSSHCRRT